MVVVGGGEMIHVGLLVGLRRGGPRNTGVRCIIAPRCELMLASPASHSGVGAVSDSNIGRSPL